MFDLLLVLVFSALSFFGWKNGFFKSVMGFLGYVIAIVAAYWAYQPITNWLMSTSYADWAAKLVRDNVIMKNIPMLQINLAWLPENIRNGMITAANTGGSVISDSVSMTFTQIFVSLTALVLVFVITFVVLKIITFVINIFMNFPVLSLFNKLFGLFVGIINGVVLVYIIILIALTMSPYVPEVGEACRQSAIRELFL